MTDALGAGGPPARVEYAVIGAGITGAAVAARLARRGAAPLIVEAGAAAGGSTGSSGGMVRCYDPDPVVAALASASLAVYADPGAWHTGVAPLHRTGAVTLAPAADAGRLRKAAEELRGTAAGGVRVVSGEAVPEVLGVQRAGSAALVEPGAGWVDPVRVTAEYLREAVRYGARLVTGVRVTALGGDTGRGPGSGAGPGSVDGDGDGGPVVMTTSAGTVRVGRAVVLATGAWAARQPAGLAPPPSPASAVRIRAIQVSVVRRPPGVPAHASFIDLRSGCYAKPAGGRDTLIGLPLLVWGGEAGSVPPADPAHHRRTLEAVRPHLAWIDRAETVRMVRSFDGWGAAGGPLTPTRLPKVWLARAGSGGGVRVAPELGRLIADQLLSTPSAAPLPAGPGRGTDARTNLL
ncbi:FAD-dependent oxidoreductase [Streptomyces sp. CAU 1734]|uniref:FAD-dependent oxidoreductase n=1 Tax=Streptomyces sp. CAU 1734 TaxID=3140360 RepID=UPI00326194BA